MTLMLTSDEGQHFAVKVSGLDMTVAVRRSARAKRFTLKVSHTERTAILTLPDRGRMEDAGAFVARHYDWLKAQIEKLPAPVSLADGSIVPLRGIAHRLTFAGPVRCMGVVWVEKASAASSMENIALASVMQTVRAMQPCSIEPFTQDGDLILPPRLCVAGGPEHAGRRLVDWLKIEAKKDLFYRVHHHAGNIGIYPKRISVRDQSTRWGSCSSSGNLSFSWRLIFAPSFVLDYVAAHEVAHLKEMNHGPRFWRVVRDTMPEMHKARLWLKKHGSELHRFNPNTVPS
ncbi:MAG: SprT family zinc-dependent metalloprotease [Hyphomicrobiales bacterium]|nr:SprT family zinc-dependent metalloprotease [Hyphomicrobiales bacterium]